MRKFKRLTIALAALFIASATAWADEAKVYTEAVAFNSLKAGDVLTDGFSITKNIGDYIKVKGYKKDSGTAETEEYSGLLNACTYPGGVVITVSDYGISGNFTPYADGKDANAWIVSKKEVIGSSTTLYLDGYNYLPAIALTEVTKGKQWKIESMPASDVELQVEYEPELTATFVAGNANTIQSGEGSKATVTVTEKDGTTAYTGATLDENGNYKPVYEGQTITLTAATGYKFKSVTAVKKAAVASSVSFTVKRVGGEDPNFADGNYTVAPGTTWQQFIESGDAPACLSIGTSGNYNGKVCHDMDGGVTCCGGTLIANVADKKRVKISDAIIDGATYGCSDYCDYEDHD